jgi:hypothetical protein
MMLRAASDEIAKLTGPEPEEVFDALRGRILQDDNFKTKPKGVDGIVRLVELHPSLQRRLLEFVRGLPTERVGAWAASSWGSCLGDAGIAAEFHTLLKGWNSQTENANLQRAAQGILAVRKA